MQKNDVLNGFGALGSAIALFIALLWNIGLFQLVFSFLAGSLSTYFIQRTLQDREEKKETKKAYDITMRDRIYGPAYERLSSVSESIDNFQNLSENEEDSPIEGIKRIKGNYLFLLTDEEVNSKICKIYKDLIVYRKNLSKADKAIHNFCSVEIRRDFPGIPDVNPNDIKFLLYDFDTVVETMTLREAILKKINLADLFAEEKKSYQKTAVRMKIPKVGEIELARSNTLFQAVEIAAWGDIQLIDHDNKRKEIKNDLELIIPRLREKIKNEEIEKAVIPKKIFRTKQHQNNGDITATRSEKTVT